MGKIKRIFTLELEDSCKVDTSVIPLSDISFVNGLTDPFWTSEQEKPGLERSDSAEKEVTEVW